MSDTPTPSSEALRLIACLNEWQSYLSVALEQLQIDAVNRLEHMSLPDAATAFHLTAKSGLLDQHVDNQSLHVQWDLTMVLLRLTAAVTDDLNADRSER